MKFIVDSLPYYGESCPFQDSCYQAECLDCPAGWDKYKVYGEYGQENPRQCEHLIEYKQFIKEQKE